MAPTHFTATEGDMLSPWTFGEVEPSQFLLRGDRCVPINGCKVHALFWDPLRGDFLNPKAARWDCINGWTKPLYVAVECEHG